MATPEIKLNLTDGAKLSRRYEGLQTIETGTVVAQIKGLTDGSSLQSQTALRRAMAVAQATFPPYSPIPGVTSVGVVIGHTVSGYSINDDAVNVTMTIDTPTVNNTPTFIVSDTTSTVPSKTQILRQNGNIIQLQIQFQVPPNNGQGGNGPGQDQQGAIGGNGIYVPILLNQNGLSKQWIPEIAYDEVVRKIVFNAVLVGRNFQAIRQAVRSVNNATYLGMAAGYWKFDSFHTETKDLGKTYGIQAEITSYLDHDWSVYAVLKDRNTGQYVQCDQADLDQAEKQAYKWGYIYGGPLAGGAGGAAAVAAAIGGIGKQKPFIRVGPYVTKNFSTLFQLPSNFKG